MHREGEENSSEKEYVIPGNAMEKDQRESLWMLEAVIFASREPLTLGELSEACPNIRDIGLAVSELKNFYKDRGINLVRIKNSYTFRSAQKYSFLLKKHVKKVTKLSKAAKETLTIIAYNQPITRVELESVRGVAIYRGILDTLLETEWITLGRRKKSPGRPITYVTTDKFLDHFGLESITDMPNFKELRESAFIGQDNSGT